MAIFPHIEIESTVQEGDRTRIKADKTFISSDEANITKLEIEPFSGNGFIDVTGSSSPDWYLDWEYATAGSRTETISVRVTTDGSPSTSTKTISVISSSDDKLFSTDNDLIAHEPDIMSWVQQGRNSYLNVHRQAQTLILDWLDNKGYTDNNGDRLTKASIIDIQEVKEWSKFMVLMLIFDGISNAVDDIFNVKARKYEDMANDKKNRSVLRLDYDNDGDAELGELIKPSSARLVRL